MFNLLFIYFSLQIYKFTVNSMYNNAKPFCDIFLVRDFHADFLEEFEAQRASRGKGRKRPGEEEEKEE